MKDTEQKVDLSKLFKKESPIRDEQGRFSKQKEITDIEQQGFQSAMGLGYLYVPVNV